jgi:Domain of unknown function (DUF4271)
MVGFLSILLLAFQTGTPVLDLRPLWSVYVDKAYRAPDEAQLSEEHTVYFSIDMAKHGGHSLYLSSLGQGYVFVDGKLIGSFTEVALYGLDSLRDQFGSPLWMAVHTEGKLSDLKTLIVFDEESLARGAPVLERRPPTFFRDYGILASLFLVFFLLLLFRTNPQLTLDYFSFTKVFSSSERNETQLASRITSSENLLFYLFCALSTGFLLSAIFYSSGPFFQAARPLVFTSLGSSFLIWLRLSVFILLLLAAKLSIVLIFSTLFNFRETVSFQFFNFLRFVLFTSVVMAGISLGLYMLGVTSPSWYERLIVVGLIMLSLGSVMVLMKLLRKSHLSFFHLFSYLCISEFIPLVILFKIFF